ncbi:MAG: organomercurial lyase [Gammaproteobacteria bacterium]|jgi:mercuric reductase
MDVTKIEAAVERLERNLPIRRNQTRLDEPLRQLHRRILRHYLERGNAQADGDPDGFGDWQGGVDRLAAEQIIVVDETGSIIGAYPFVEEAREFRVVTRFGAVNAMCAFDALAVSSMFEIPTRVESRCRLSGRAIVIEQNRADIRVAEPGEPVFAAIDWNAAGGTGSCALNLCTEMIFIAGDARAAEWCGEDTDKRELFALPEAHAIIAQIFMPLMR